MCMNPSWWSNSSRLYSHISFLRKAGYGQRPPQNDLIACGLSCSLQLLPDDVCIFLSVIVCTLSGVKLHAASDYRYCDSDRVLPLAASLNWPPVTHLTVISSLVFIICSNCNYQWLTSTRNGVCTVQRRCTNLELAARCAPQQEWFSCCSEFCNILSICTWILCHACAIEITQFSNTLHVFT